MNADLHALLDSLTPDENVKASWEVDGYRTTIEGPVRVHELYRECAEVIRHGDGTVNNYLVAFEVTHTEEVTATRVDEERLHALLDSLTNGQEVTAEWCNDNGSMVITGKVRTAAATVGVRGFVTFPMRWSDGRVHAYLHSVTVRRPVVKRWERESSE